MSDTESPQDTQDKGSFRSPMPSPDSTHVDAVAAVYPSPTNIQEISA